MDGLTLPQQALICLTYGVTLVCSGLALYGTARRFLTVRSLGWGKAILFLTFGISTGMVIWVGDPNLLYVFPLLSVLFSAASMALSRALPKRAHKSISAIKRFRGREI